MKYYLKTKKYKIILKQLSFKASDNATSAKTKLLKTFKW